MRRFLWALVPLVVLGVLVAMFAFGIGRDPYAIPSPLINKPFPAFSLSTLNNPDARINAAKLRGKVVLVNVFASWCTACADETEALSWLAGQGVVIYGLDYSDTRPGARAWLAHWGNPYHKVLFDPAGETGIALGIYGVPETFVVDRDGRIRHKYTGAISANVAKTAVLPLVRKLESGP